MASSLQLNQAHVPQHKMERGPATVNEILGKKFPKTGCRRMTHEEQVCFWQGRFAALADVDGNYQRVGRLLLEAETQLANLRALEVEGK